MVRVATDALVRSVLRFQLLLWHDDTVVLEKCNCIILYFISFVIIHFAFIYDLPLQFEMCLLLQFR